MEQAERQFEQNASRNARGWSRAAGEDSIRENEQNRGRSRSHNGGSGNGQIMNIADVAIRGTARLLDIEFATLRMFWQIQARSAAAFGAPDCSDMIRRAESSMQRLLSTGTEQMLSNAHQAAQAFTEMQNQVSQVIEENAEQVTEEIRQGMEEFGERSREGVSTMRETTEAAAGSLRRNSARGSSDHEQQSERDEGGQTQQQAGAESEQDPDQRTSQPGAGTQNKNAGRNSRPDKRH